MRSDALWRVALAVVLVLLVSFAAAAAPKQDPTFNPKPALDDLILPMPGGLEMAFRRISVPGKDFWFDQDREITLGDPDINPTSPDPFSAERPARVAGVFFDARAGIWWYPIGKYEVSKAQFATVMGDGDITKGLERLAQLSGDRDDQKLAGLPQGRDRESRLAEPVRFIPWSAVQEFIQRYNGWLLGDPGRVAAFPAVLSWKDGAGKDRQMPGFVRLPSEVEWEYAARGGEEARRQGPAVFRQPLPFDRAAYQSFVWVGDNARAKVRPIGSRDPVYGLYDMLGNVSEFVADPFRPEQGLGKVGGLVVRGGHVSTSLNDLKSGLRQEQAIYQEDPQKPGRFIEARPPFTGFRLAVGAMVSPDSAYREALVQSFKSYAATRQNPNVSTSGTASAILQSSVRIGRLRDQLKQLQGRNAIPGNDAQALLAGLDEVEQLQDREIRATIADLLRAAVRVAAGHGKSVCKLQEMREKVLPAARRLAQTSTQYQQQVSDLERGAAELDRIAADEFANYVDVAKRLNGYGDAYVEDGLERVGRQQWPTGFEKRSFELLKQHLEQQRGGQVDQARWRAEMGKEFAWVPGRGACI